MDYQKLFNFRRNERTELSKREIPYYYKLDDLTIIGTNHTITNPPEEKVNRFLYELSTFRHLIMEDCRTSWERLLIAGMLNYENIALLNYKEPVHFPEDKANHMDIMSHYGMKRDIIPFLYLLRTDTASSGKR